MANMAEQGDEQKTTPTTPTGFWETTADHWNPMIVLEFRKTNPGIVCILVLGMLLQIALIVFLMIGVHGDFYERIEVFSIEVFSIVYLDVAGMVAVFVGLREGRIRFSIKRDWLYDWLGGDMIFRRGQGDPDELLEQNPLPDLQKFHARFLIGLIWSSIVSMLVLPLAVVFDIFVNREPVATFSILGGIYCVQTLRLVFHSLFPLNRTVGEYLGFLFAAVLSGVICVVVLIILSISFESPHGDTVGFGYFVVMPIVTPIVAYHLIRHHLSMPRKDSVQIALANSLAYVCMVGFGLIVPMAIILLICSL